MRKLYMPEPGSSEAAKWLCHVLNESQISARQLAPKIHVSHQTIYNLLYGKTNFTFPIVAAICYVTKMYDPEEVWNEISL